MTGFVVLTTTVASQDEARAMARMLVERRLAACVQIMPIESIYRWAGAVETAREHLLSCNIREHDIIAVQAAIGALHRYDVPEIVVVPIVAGSAVYLGWLGESTGSAA
jgi:periplasmic divalent cation tolerance protein